MGGFFGVASREDCVRDLFYGTDYHSHLGTMRGGMAVSNGGGVKRCIHNITNAQFRSKFEDDLSKLDGTRGIGVISDNEDQPLLIGSHMGLYGIVTVGVIKNLEALAARVFAKKSAHFTEMRGGAINPTEMIATLINQEGSFEEGLQHALEAVEGSCSILLLTGHGIYAARDQYGRTPVIIGCKESAFAATLETCAFPNLDYKIDRYLGPGEVVRFTEEGCEQLVPPSVRLQICSFLWVYYGYPASHYEGINVEECRNRCGAALARREIHEIDLVAGIPDSGTGHGLGFAAEAKLPYRRPFVKYTPTWPRSFMPQDQRVRDLVARMKLIPVPELIKGQRMLFCEDSIVRGTQLQDTIKRLFDSGAEEVHMRPACPPLIFGCKFLNFSQSKSELDLAGRKAIQEIEGTADRDLYEYSNPDSDKYALMLKRIEQRLGLSSLAYQRLDDLVEAIGMPKKKLCTYCWDGAE